MSVKAGIWPVANRELPITITSRDYKAILALDAADFKEVASIADPEICLLE